MEVKYTLTREDFIAYQLFVTRQPGYGMPRTGLVFACVLFFLLAACWFAARGQTQNTILYLIIGVVFGAGFAVMRRQQSVRLHRFFDRVGEGSMFGPAVLFLGDQTLTEVTPAARREFRWDRMWRVWDTPDHIFIMVNPLAGLIVPRHSIDPAGAFDAVRDCARAKVPKLDEHDPP
jgi:hypothetical protein